MKIQVKHLSYNVTEEDLRHAFEAFGKVESAKIVKDIISGKSKGTALILMPSEEEAAAAIKELQDTDLKGRPLKLSEVHAHRDADGAAGTKARHIGKFRGGKTMGRKEIGGSKRAGKRGDR